MKELLAEAGVPTARFGVFTEVGPRRRLPADSLDGPWVVKTDGLAAGKGVLVTDSLAEAEADVAAKLSGDAFGAAGRRVVIEEGLTGPECSLLVLCDGERLAPLAPAQDFKRRDDGDGGPNTGGMGAYSPVPLGRRRTRRLAGGRGRGPAGAAPAGPGHRLPGRALRRADADPVGTRRSWSSTSASATPRPRSSCPASRATWRRCWPRWPPARLVTTPTLRRPTRPCAWCWRPRAIPSPPAPATAIDGLADAAPDARA